MQEQLITFETAKLAKEKGFLIHSIDTFYQFDGSISLCHPMSIRANDCKDINKPECYAPHQAFLQKWLREVHNIHLNLSYYQQYNEETPFYDITIDYIDKSGKMNYHEHRIKTSTKYEDVLEAGLHEALKLIEIVKCEK
jgi:hypothetical protein